MIKRPSRPCALLVVSFLGLLVPVIGRAQVLVADYQFNGNLNSSVAGAPALVNPPSTGSGGGGAGTFTTSTINGNTLGTLSMPAASGLGMTITGLLPSTGNSSSYTVAILFEDTNATGGNFQSLFDPSGGTKDNHTYLDSGKLDFYHGTTAYAGSVSSNTWTQVIETVDLSSGNAVVQTELTPVGGTAVYNSFNFGAPSPNNGYEVIGSTINFFRDDSQGTGDNFNAASVARIEVYNSALSQSQMAAIDLTQEAPVPEPQTWAMLLCGAGYLICFRRFRSRGRA